MKSSEQLNELADALSKAQGVMQFALKDSKNPFFKSSYADLTSIVSCIQKPLSDNGLSFVQAMRLEGELKVLETILLHKSGQWISSDYPVTPTKSDPQSLGSATSYARRYGLQALIGVVADDDDDGEASMNRGLDQKKNSLKKEELKSLPKEINHAFNSQSVHLPDTSSFIDNHVEQKKSTIKVGPSPEEDRMIYARKSFIDRVDDFTGGDKSKRDDLYRRIGFNKNDKNLNENDLEYFEKKIIDLVADSSKQQTLL